MIVRRVGLLIAMAVVSLSPVFSPSVANAQEGGGGCVVNQATLTCDAQAGTGGGDDQGSSPVPADDDSGGGGGSGPVGPQEPRDFTLTQAGCTWRSVGGPAADAIRARMRNAPSNAVFQIPVGCDANDLAGADPVNQGQWVLPGEEAPPAPADPNAVAEGVLVGVQAQMHAPAVLADPPVGTPSVVSLPVFVQVTNWQGDVSESGCDGAVCVEITATPTLTFEPGEPGAAAIECAPPGTRFDPAGADPEVQAAAAGACAHVYTARTGSGGRPAEWPAQVTVTWAVSWTSNVGVNGEFEPLSLSTAVPRAVNEVQTVVVD